MTLTLLHPRWGEVRSDDDLLDLYDGTGVTASMIGTVDGAATGADGRSGSINGPADLRVFTALRTLADVVLVGAGTVRVEGYRALRLRPERVAARRARGLADQPTLAVVTRTGNLPEDLLTGDPAPWVFTTPDAPHLGRLRATLPPGRLVVGEGPDLTGVVAHLREAGARRLVTEGGPHLLGDLLAAGLVDDVCVTTAPRIVGGPALRLTSTDWLRPALDLDLVHLLLGDGMLLARWRVRGQKPVSVTSG